MQIKIFGNDDKTTELLNLVNMCLDDLGLKDFISCEKVFDQELKKELDIKLFPALIIEEPEIEFKDIIFEGIVPKKDEISQMITSIVGGESSNDCSSGCGGCSGC